jgi:hypothetical protein
MARAHLKKAVKLLPGCARSRFAAIIAEKNRRRLTQTGST